VGFKDIKRIAIDYLKKGAFDHEARTDINVKNLFSIGMIDTDYVISLINKTSGEEYQSSPHHQDKTIDVHIFRPFKDDFYWYIKFYIIEPDIIFISIHK